MNLLVAGAALVGVGALILRHKRQDMYQKAWTPDKLVAFGSVAMRADLDLLDVPSERIYGLAVMAGVLEASGERITSAIRSVESNRAAGGRSDSKHLVAAALDLGGRVGKDDPAELRAKGERLTRDFFVGAVIDDFYVESDHLHVEFHPEALEAIGKSYLAWRDRKEGNA